MKEKLIKILDREINIHHVLDFCQMKGDSFDACSQWSSWVADDEDLSKDEEKELAYILHDEVCSLYQSIEEVDDSLL